MATLWGPPSLLTKVSLNGFPAGTWTSFVTNWRSCAPMVGALGSAGAAGDDGPLPAFVVLHAAAASATVARARVAMRRFTDLVPRQWVGRGRGGAVPAPRFAAPGWCSVRRRRRRRAGGRPWPGLP